MSPPFAPIIKLWLWGFVYSVTYLLVPNVNFTPLEVHVGCGRFPFASPSRPAVSHTSVQPTLTMRKTTLWS